MEILLVGNAAVLHRHTCADMAEWLCSLLSPAPELALASTSASKTCSLLTLDSEPSASALLGRNWGMLAMSRQKSGFPAIEQRA